MGGFEVRANGSCEQGFEFLDTFADSARARVSVRDCSWERTGNTLVMAREDGYRATDQILGNRLNMTGYDNQSFVYER